jgi:cytochrome c peroxidase
MRFTLPLLLALAACGGSTEAPKPAEPTEPAKVEAPTVDRAKLGAFAALPTEMPDASNPITPEKIDLGRQLYYDARLSKNHDVSCNTCHLLDQYGVDSAPTSTGHKGQKGGRNAPTSYNAAGHIAQFWDGRAATIEDQAKGPPLNPIEMAMASEEAVVTVLKSIPGYVDGFGKAFPGEAEPVTYDNMAKAIGAFERKLVTPDAFDRFLGGEDAALTDDQKKGLATFMEVGCTTCHAGPYLGGQMYQKAGLVQPWPNQADAGRFDVTKNEADRMMFKVPSLRNIAKTGPYFHDGSVADLGEAVKMMGKHQLGKELTDEQTQSIVSFLGALTGTIPADYIAKPALPESGPTTPAPDPS